MPTKKQTAGQKGAATRAANKAKKQAEESAKLAEEQAGKAAEAEVIAEEGTSGGAAVEATEQGSAASVAPTPEKIVDETVKGPVQAATTKAVIVGSDEKMVRIRGLRNHTCTIGKITYGIIQDVVIPVPDSVATILGNARIVVKL